MGVVFRQSVKSTLAVFGGAVFGAGVLFLGPLVMPKSEVGFTRNLINQAAVLQFVALLGFNHVLSTFIPRYAENDVRRKVLFTAGLLLPVVACALGSIPYFLFKNEVVGKFQAQDVPFLIRFYGWLPLLVVLWAMMSMMESYLMVEKRIAVSAFAREIIIKAGNLLLIALVGIGWLSFSGLVGGMVLLYIVPVAVMMVVASRFKSFGFSTQWAALSRKEWREIIHFAWYHLLFGAALSLVGFIDALMLAPLSEQGMQSVAVYSIAVYIASIPSIPYRAMTSSVFPVLNEAYIAADQPKVHDLFKRSGINILVVAVAVMAVLVPCLPALTGFLPSSYASVTPLVLILLIGRLVDMLTGMNSELISISPHYKFLFRISLLLVVALIAANRVLIPRFGFYGAAWSATLALTAFNMGKMVFLWVRFRLHPFSRSTAKIIVAGLLAAGAAWLVPDTGVRLATLALNGAVALGVYGGLLLWLRPSPDLQAYVQSIRKTKRLF